MSEKQIFAALEIADHEVRLIVGEFFNTRFNIIKVERVPVTGLVFNEVTNPEAITEAIRRAVQQSAKMIGADIRRVILAIPSYHLKRYSYSTSVNIEGIDGKVTVQDIRKAVRDAESVHVDKKYIVVQSVVNKYTVNGVSSRRRPIGEKADQLTIDADILCADRKMAFDLVTCVENAGLQIMDIFVDLYAVGKESALFEQAIDHQVIILKMEREMTALGLIRNGRLTTGTMLPSGIGTIAGAIMDKYGIKSDLAVELLKYSARLNHTVLSTNPVYIWAENGETHTINEQELVDCVRENINLWLNDLQKTCSPILQAGETTVMITGEGGETNGLDELVQDRLGVSVKKYIPDTLGGRNACLTSCLGLFYAYQDKFPITEATQSSLDLDEFIRHVSYRERSADDSKEHTLTDKLKGLFKEGKK